MTGTPSETLTAGDAIDEHYVARIAEVDARLAEMARRERRVLVGRLLAAAAVLVAGIWILQANQSWWWLSVPGLVFVGLVGWHEHLREVAAVERRLKQVREWQRARRNRQWDRVPVPPPPERLTALPIARDLDLAGSRSVLHWLSTAHTPQGREMLADWLVNPATPEVLAGRQQIVRRLATEWSWRDELQLHGSLLATADTGAEQFVAWAQGPRWLSQRGWLSLLSYAVAVVSLAAGLGFLLGWLTAWLALAAGGIAIGIGIGLSFLYLGRVHDIFDTVSGRADQVGRYLAMLDVAARLPASVGRVSTGQRDLRELAGQATRQLARLRWLTQLAALRRSSLWGLLVLVAQWTLLWEFHLLRWFELWQQRHGAEAAEWFAALAELESLAALATVAHDEPEWVFATVDPRATTLKACQLGHPLLARQRRVANDVELGPAGTFLLVTGSNMSGKSTLLRALGVNVLLAQAGGVVPARELVLPPVEVATSMRVTDSLADGVSFFFAELLRLKQIVDRARSDEGSPRRLLYLLDEILQGTNSRERQAAVARVIGHLLDHGAIGAVSTHDLELAGCERLRDCCRAVHFRETIVREGARQAMSFDYRLRDGLAPTTNALVLLDLVGLGDPT